MMTMVILNMQIREDLEGAGHWSTCLSPWGWSCVKLGRVQRGLLQANPNALPREGGCVGVPRKVRRPAWPEHHDS